jgi:hypothetical protein
MQRQTTGVRHVRAQECSEHREREGLERQSQRSFAPVARQVEIPTAGPIELVEHLLKLHRRADVSVARVPSCQAEHLGKDLALEPARVLVVEFD